MSAQNLSQLLRAAGLRAAASETPVRGLDQDSRRVKKGWLFCALPSASGKHADTVAYVAQAVAQGAVAVLADVATLKRAALPGKVLGLASRDVRGDSARLFAAWHGQPARHLALTGVTGTNGKTTTSFLLRGLLEKAGRPAALIGTVGYWVGGKRLEAPNTTPSALELQALFAQARAKGAKAAVMEVSSHALDQQRVEGLDFKVAIFTNLTRDHLDYHKTLAAYAKAKARLFGMLKPDGVAVVNADDALGLKMAAARTRGARRLSYSAEGRKADLQALDLSFEPDASRFTLSFGGRQRPLRLPLPGRFNVANALAAAGAALAQGLSLDAVVAGLEKPLLPPGRFELIRQGQPFAVAVDYAHTPDALERLILSAREVTPCRVLCVFGCGGDRDRGKRPMMGALAAKLCELSFITSDNPRSEKPEAIIKAVAAGVAKTHRFRVLRCVDRRKAIALALGSARPGDCVLIAGKGHEDYQIVGTKKLHFDDREEAKAALRRLGWKGRR